MTDQLVSWEIAKLAKEKGFGMTSNTLSLRGNYYNHKGVLDGDVTELIRAQIHEEDTTPFKTICAPTQSLLQRWLREKHRAHINIVYLFEHDVYVPFTQYIDVTTEPVVLKDEKNKSLRFSTYEEAFEAALLESLKLIQC
jgi:hypothetical protein